MRYIHDGRTSLVKFLTACVLFLICFFYCGMAQARYVKLLQKVHPEKKGDIASKDFHEQWLEAVMRQKRKLFIKVPTVLTYSQEN